LPFALRLFLSSYLALLFNRYFTLHREGVREGEALPVEPPLALSFALLPPLIPTPASAFSVVVTAPVSTVHSKVRPHPPIDPQHLLEVLFHR
jgi:hypothetical protein